MEPVFKTASAKTDALNYAMNRFGGCPNGEIHVYDDAGEKIVEKIPVDGGRQYGQTPPETKR